MCNPFVPGIIYGNSRVGPVIVSVWPGGPAEQAGLCPGDLIRAVGKLPTVGASWNSVLKGLVSEARSPVLVRVSRGSRDLIFEVSRVRETTLAARSHQRWVRTSALGGTGLRLIPAAENPAELRRLDEFESRAAAVNGFKWIDGMLVPARTPVRQVRQLIRFRADPRAERRVVSHVTFAGSRYSAGFSALILKGPAEVVVSGISPGSPSFAAGLLPGDRIVRINGQPCAELSSGQIRAAIITPDMPREIRLTVRRAATTIELNIQAIPIEAILKADFATPLPAPKRFGAFPAAEDYYIGVEVLFSKHLGEAVIENVAYPSPAFAAGLQVGDKILSLNDEPVSKLTRRKVERILSPIGTSTVNLIVVRAGKQLHFRINPATYGATLDKIGWKPTKTRPAPKHCPNVAFLHN